VSSEKRDLVQAGLQVGLEPRAPGGLRPHVSKPIEIRHRLIEGHERLVSAGWQFRYDVPRTLQSRLVVSCCRERVVMSRRESIAAPREHAKVSRDSFGGAMSILFDLEEFEEIANVSRGRGSISIVNVLGF